MLITFKSKAAADVVMYKEHAKRILDLLGKDVDRGVLTSEECSPAIAKIEGEIAHSRLHSASDALQHDVAAHHGADGDDNEHEAVQPVSFASRAFPLLEMMRAACSNKQSIAWGI